MVKHLLKSLLLLCALVVGSVSGRATEVTYKLTISSENFNSTSYAANNNEKTSTAVCITDAQKTFDVKWTSNQVMIQSGEIQWQKNNGYIYNSTDLGTIMDVTVNSSAGTFTTYYGTTEQPSSNTTVGGGFFKIKVGNATGKISNIEVTFTINEGPSTYNVSYDANGGSGTMTDSDSPYEAGTTVDLLPNTFTPPAGQMFDCWAVTDASSNVVTVTNNQFTMPASNVTVTAQWQAAANYITVSPTTKEMTSDGADAEFTITTDQTLDEYPTQFYTTADGDVITSKPEWITEARYDKGTLLLTVAANTGAARTAYFKVENGSVKSNVITINQAAKTYTIDQYTSSATAHGTITFSPASPVEVGTEVTLTATPDESYTFTADSWTFYKESGEDFVVDNSITVTDSKITMPAYALYVDATFTPIAVTGVTLNKNATTIGIGETETLTATVTPADALNKAVTWTSSNTSVATVADGVVTGVAEGSATITVTTTDGSFTATCEVNVMNAVTFNATSDTGTSLSKNGVSFTTSATESNVYKFYKNSSTTFSVTNGKITKIEFTGVSGYSASGFKDQSGWTTNGNDGTWSGSATSVSFTASGAQVRASVIKVYVANTATPTFSVAEGKYDAAQDVTISCATDGATIYYTTDGSTPTSSSTAYTSAIHITETTTLKAIAIKSGVESDVASATYTMNRPVAPAFDIAEGVFDTAFDLHLSTETDGATIYYTTDGTTPTTSSSTYSTKVEILTATTTVKAIAVKNGLTSDVASATYTYDSRITPTFTLSMNNIDLKVNETSSAVTLTTSSDATPSFTCEDAHVTLTGSGNSYTISANAAGTYTVNVSLTGSANYKDAEGTITVNVTKKATTMALTPSFSSKDLKETKSGSFTGAPQYNSSDIAGAEVTYSSSVESVATIASDGTVTFKKAGSTTLTASYAGNDEYEECEATYELVLYDTTPQSTEVDITFGNALYGTSYTGAGAAGNGPFEGTVNNVTVTVAQGSGANLYVTNTETRIYGGTTKGTITIAAPTGYVMTKIVITKGSSWNVTASPGTLSTATWTGNASTVVFSASSRSDFQSAKVTLAPVVTLNTYGYGTFCSAHPIDFSKAEGFTAWRVSNVAADGTITFVKITETIKEGQGVLLYNKDADGVNKTTFTLAVGESEGATEFTSSENKLVGTTVPIEVEANQYYGLSGNEFVKVNAGTVKAGKALLPAAVVSNGARLTFVFEDATGISATLTDNEQMINDGVYDLQGRRIESSMFNLQSSMLKKGLYIVNGKKMLVK